MHDDWWKCVVFLNLLLILDYVIDNPITFVLIDSESVVYEIQLWSVSVGIMG
jgi:hypothetical protein